MSGNLIGINHQQGGNMLLPGDKFPQITLSLVGGGEITLPNDVIESWAYVLFYRGGW